MSHPRRSYSGHQHHYDFRDGHQKGTRRFFIFHRVRLLPGKVAHQIKQEMNRKPQSRAPRGHERCAPRRETRGPAELFPPLLLSSPLLLSAKCGPASPIRMGLPVCARHRASPEEAGAKEVKWVPQSRRAYPRLPARWDTHVYAAVRSLAPSSVAGIATPYVASAGQRSEWQDEEARGVHSGGRSSKKLTWTHAPPPHVG
jgi:hypothetical protein